MAWHTYQNLEKDFIDVSRYVALEKKNDGAYSERIAQLLQLTGSTVDSLFFEMRTSPSLAKQKGVADLQQNPEPNIGQYREVYEPIYQLSQVELVAHHGLTNYGTIRPFNPFLPKQYPEWWDAYNEIKHEFFQNWRRGTLGNLVHALGALFTLNVLHKDAQFYLLRRGVIMPVTGHANATYLPTSLSTYSLDPFRVWNVMKRSFIGLPNNATYGAMAFSEVFAHSFRRDLNVTVEEDSGSM
jgi:hypothetical protein